MWRWDKARLDEAEALLKTVTTLREAAAILSKRWKYKVSVASLGNAFRNHKNCNPSTILKQEKHRPRPVVAGATSKRGLLEDYVEGGIVKALRKERTDLLKRLAVSERRNEIVAAAGAPIKLKPIVALEKTSRIREGTSVVCASDWHIEEIVDPRTVVLRNAFDLKIAQERVKRFTKAVHFMHGMARTRYKLRHMVLWLGGDFISGHIYEDLAESNQLSPIEAILLARQLLNGAIRSFLSDKELVRIDIPCNYGNHGRTTKKKRVQTAAKNSYEWLLYRLLEDDFSGEKRVHFNVAYGAHSYHTVYGRRLHFHHGDDVLYNGGVGGITIPLRKAMWNWQTVEAADIHHVAHFHEYLDLGDIVCNSSLIGYTPFSMKIKARFTEPEQAFYIIDSKRGKCLNTPLWVAQRATKASRAKLIW